MRLRLIGALGVGILLTILGATGASAATNTVAIGAPATVTDRILVTIPVTVVCDPLPGTPFQWAVTVTLQQADGGSVSTGTGFSGAFLTCDGVTQNTEMVDVTPGSGSGPFHGGGAVATASFFYQTAMSCGPGCFFGGASEGGGTAQTPISLRR